MTIKPSMFSVGCYAVLTLNDYLLMKKRKPWTEADEQALIEGMQAGLSVSDLATKLSRSEASITTKARLLENKINSTLALSDLDKKLMDELVVKAARENQKGALRKLFDFVFGLAPDLAALDRLQIRKYASKGMPIDSIAELTNLSIPSVRGHLVHAGLYDEYCKLSYEVLREQIPKLEKKLGIADNGTLSLKEKQRMQDPVFVMQLIEHHEDKQVEFKQTFQRNLKTGDIDVRMKHAVVKTVAGFLNSIGGYLLIGVKDSGLPSGIFDDDMGSADQYTLKLVDTLKTALGKTAVSLVDVVIVKMPTSEEVCLVKCSPSSSPIMCTHGEYNISKKLPKDHELFYVRQSAQTVSLSPSEMLQYLKGRQFES